MGISKAWILSKMEYAQSKQVKVSAIEIHENDDYWRGVEHGLKQCYNELTSAPTKTIPKEIDIDKGYDSIVKYYMDKKGYTKEHANEIAMKCINDQKQKVLK